MTKEEAKELAETGWWKTKTPREIVAFQLFERRLCMDFGAFHEAVEKSIGRPVWSHEFALNLDGIKKEFLGEGQPPSMQEIIEMIPEAKRIVVVLP